MTTVREVMSTEPIGLPGTSTVQEAARLMRDQDVGDVLVIDDDRLEGVVTDRDIVVRGLADGLDGTTPLAQVCTETVVTLGPETTLEDAAQTMREQSVRRLPVVDGTQPIGVVSLGDLAIEQDEASVLAEISADGPNN